MTRERDRSMHGNTDPIYLDMILAALLWAVMTWRFGHLVRPRWKVVGKTVFYLAVSFALAHLFGHWSLLFIVGQPAVGIFWHLYICRKHAINWWTCEPRDRYLALQTEWAEKLAKKASASRDQGN